MPSICVSTADCIDYARNKITFLASLFSAANETLQFNENGICGLCEILIDIDELLEGAELMLTEGKKGALAEVADQAKAPNADQSRSTIQ